MGQEVISKADINDLKVILKEDLPVIKDFLEIYHLKQQLKQKQQNIGEA